jgi:hypothetical protein
VAELETLKAIATLGLLANNIQDGIDQFSTLSVMSLCPIVSSAGLPEDEVIRAKQLAKRAGTDTVHSARLEVHEDCARDITPSRGFVVININPLQLQV